LPIDVPWLLQLTADAWRDARYRDSLVATFTTHLLLFGSLIAGGLLSRPRQPARSFPIGIALPENQTQANHE
jgi:hypothetical protein